ncbi:acetyl-CoA carboxylase biotin carboxyl carrier protein [Polymorphobacter fuscus]|uniref:Biotin carboxyl carrier protein of acetyl-CoA carboxylase n=1 Tax=Sandarakinorhabdus fusca TaxID=1439888 RepID=A0A7C9GNY0_9SPHN|nr:acetyl-CoA carboxylase biotin carboxyl carrier protein [Polymorphobacter fuscus]KAB7649011.1 acetyl-CoA carboxylase biotin carboxyl carrier protein [Polymorphobacter fuscus]MQT16613.1 acetyl-CoA carboxylase biotin carboxyl carrier protein [Polymorphobacter fuscus]NJC07097.1 acetyl-CoA carboxylase biotin carboxyl carrier protein [Polymorphobacter fuscus]
MPEGSGIQVDTALVRELAELLESSHLTEIEVKDGDRTIRVARTAAAVTQGFAPAPNWGPAPAPAAAAAAAPAAPAADDWKSHPGLVKSPIVGTAYLTPEPGAPPFVAEGASVVAGATLLIIEAMKVMNPITAPKSGKVVKVLIRSEQPVEYDEPLVVIE